MASTGQQGTRVVGIAPIDGALSSGMQMKGRESDQACADGAPINTAKIVARLRDLQAGAQAFLEVIALGSAAIPSLEAFLRGRSESIYQPRCLAADAIAAIAGPAGFAALRRALADSLERRLDPVLGEAETAVINRVAEHLGALGNPQAADLLLEALRRHPYAGCARALGCLRDPRAVPRLVECLYDDVAREAAVESLRAFGRLPVSHLTRALLQPRLDHGIEGSSKVADRAAAATLLAELGGDEVRLPLLWSLHDAQREVRVAAALALVQHHGLKVQFIVLPALLDALGDERWERAEPVADALIALRTTETLQETVRCERRDAGRGGAVCAPSRSWAACGTLRRRRHLGTLRPNLRRDCAWPRCLPWGTYRELRLLRPWMAFSTIATRRSAYLR
jgi:HEAT repeat protein